MKRLKLHDEVPIITGPSFSGKEISLNDYQGRPLILSFYRYAGCQLCNLRMKRFIDFYSEVCQPAGVAALAVFQSSIPKLDKNLYNNHEIPFEVISDPDMKWYKAFGVGKSWLGLIKEVIQPVDFISSTIEGYAKIDPDGPMNRLPADFLISRSGYIEEAFYAKKIGEHIPLSRIRHWIEKSSKSK